MSDDLDFLPAGSAGDPDKRESAEADPSKSKSKAKSSSSGPEPGDDPIPGERAELPTWNRSRRKRKANVKAEKQDDAFQRSVRQAGRQVVDTPKLVIGAIVITVAAIAGGVALHNRKVEANAEAARVLQAATAAIVRGQVVPAEQQAELAEAIKYHRGPIYATEEEHAAAIDEALSEARASSRRGVEHNATLVAAARAMRNGDFDGALTEYETFLDSAAKDHPLRFLALEGKGHALEGKGEHEAALAVFAAIAPHPTDFYRPMALYHQGRVLEALERKDEALAIYQQYFDEFPATREEMATPLVRQRVEALDPDFAARLVRPQGPSIPTL
ncbi:MAG: tetratricopeptide repeat protein [Enhygromyxa sp.]